jgi:UDP-glucose 4-epimerase
MTADSGEPIEPAEPNESQLPVLAGRSDRTDYSRSLARIALTGACGFLGGLVLKRLLALPEVQEIHIFDVRPPVQTHSNKLFFHRLDLTRDAADEELAQALIDRGVTTFLHGALFNDPGRYSAERREVESIGTFHVLNAVAEARVERLFVFGSTLVYGARTSNPNFMRESQPLPTSSVSFVRTRVDVEKQVAGFAHAYPQTQVLVLRFAPVMGPSAQHTLARYFLSGVVPKVLGYDPLFQFIHEDDALRAVLLALQSGCRGAYNITGKGVIPLSTGIHLCGRFPIPVPSFMVGPVLQTGRALGVWGPSAQMAPFFKYLCVADGEKARQELGFEARYSSRQALKSMVEAYRLRKIGFSTPSSSLGEERPSARQPGFERVL